MRQIGMLPSQEDANRFSAFLLTQDIESQVELEDQAWAIWIKDENRVAESKSLLGAYQQNPNDPKYTQSLAEAQKLVQQKLQRAQQTRKNMVDMRGKWPSTHRPPVQPCVSILMILSILVTVPYLLGDRGSPNSLSATIATQLMFCNPAAFLKSGNVLASIMGGQVWRLVTPIFIHLDGLHILFNMLMLHRMGSVLEVRMHSFAFAMLALTIAVISNLGQALAPADWGGTFLFGGMSGVVYGLFGYLWIKTRFDSRYLGMLDSTTVVIMLGFLVLAGMFMSNVAHVAHGVGLVVGMTLAYLPILVRQD